MRHVLINVIETRRKLGQSDKEIVTGMFHTICETLELPKKQAIKLVMEGMKESEKISLTIAKATADAKAEMEKDELSGHVRRGLSSLFPDVSKLSKKAS
jgi:hypothetical protein